MKSKLIPVQIGNGVVVLHTAEEWKRLLAGVDLEVVRAMSLPIEPEEDTP